MIRVLGGAGRAFKAELGVIKHRFEANDLFASGFTF